MKKFLNSLLAKLPLNGHKLNLGLALGALLHIAPQALALVPPGYAELASTALVLLGSIHKLVK